MPTTPATPSADTPSAPAASTSARARSPARRAAMWLLVALGVVVAVLVALGMLVALMDWNRAKPWVNDKVSEAAE